MKKILLYILPWLLLAACTQDDLSGNSSTDEGQDVKMNFSLHVDESSSFSTRSSLDTEVDTAIIKNVWVIQFTYTADGTGGIIGTPQYLDNITDFSSSNMEVKLKEGTSNIYFVANTFNSGVFNSANCSTESAFKGLKEPFSTDSVMQNQLVNTDCYVPMTGVLTNQAVSATAALATTVNMIRSVALVDFNYTVDFPTGQGFKVKSARVCNVPNMMYYAKNTSVTYATTDYYDYPLELISTKNTSNTDQSGRIMFYLTDNLCGESGDGNTLSKKKLGISGKQCTYIELRGVTDDNRYVTYKLYIGKNNVTNYDVERNNYYKVDLALNGVSSYDGRISSAIIMPESNCYMVTPGQMIAIPISRGNYTYTTGLTSSTTTTTTNVAFPAGKKWTAGLLWTDNSNGVKANGAIESIAADVADGYIWVKTGTSEGNAVIYGKVDGESTYAWSWHIWVTKYNPDNTPLPANGKTYLFNTLTWMDRNLGAVSSMPGDVGTLGLMYQWGRKDPFPGANSAAVASTGTPASIYDKDGGTPLTQGTSGTGIIYKYAFASTKGAAQNPNAFYYTSTGEWNSTPDNYLWGSWHGAYAPQQKTPFDPCPVGWRTSYVSTNLGITTPWNNLTTTNGIWNLGYDWTTFGAGYYPATGYREGGETSGGTLKNVGTQCNTFSGTANGVRGYTMYFTSSSINVSNGDSRSHGFPVRCVKDVIQ